MTYRRYHEKYYRYHPLTGLWASISWESAAGTFLSNSSTDNDLPYYLGPITVGQTLTVDVVTLASGTEIPPYNCTAEFHFIDKSIGSTYWGYKSYTFALNTVSWTCTSPPVYTWCM